MEVTKVKDITTDLDVKLVNRLGGKIHQGFRDALSYIWTDLRNTLKANRGSRTLWVTGHGLGGAQATLAVTKLRQEKKQTTNGLYTFGSPRVGNKIFADKFNDDFKRYTFRFVNDNDAVPHVPPKDLGFSHIGTRMQFDEKGRLNNKMKKSSFRKKLVNRAEDIIAADDLTDHKMFNYLKNLKRLVKS